MRTLALLSLLAALAVGGYLFVSRTGDPEAAGTRIQAAEEAASAQVAAANLQSAAVALEAHHATEGTYAGASLEEHGVRLARADTTSYCLEVGAEPGVVHLAGPGGRPEPGPCR